ncbi:uncharacterized protein LOC125194637 [Salvia hispanica]|uniref:uncharacterized protein LOC125194637 n=1 Tax=Salvia hispanica TaxID=49212 RepID=UPI0020092EA0|nr:uncharacterized protein LOC125194637 [Salvia hispanica]
MYPMNPIYSFLHRHFFPNSLFQLKSLIKTNGEAAALLLLRPIPRRLRQIAVSLSHPLPFSGELTAGSSSSVSVYLFLSFHRVLSPDEIADREVSLLHEQSSRSAARVRPWSLGSPVLAAPLPESGGGCRCSSRLLLLLLLLFGRDSRRVTVVRAIAPAASPPPRDKDPWCYWLSNLESYGMPNSRRMGKIRE